MCFECACVSFDYPGYHLQVKVELGFELIDDVISHEDGVSANNHNFWHLARLLDFDLVPLEFLLLRFIGSPALACVLDGH